MIHDFAIFASSGSLFSEKDGTLILFILLLWVVGALFTLINFSVIVTSCDQVAKHLAIFIGYLALTGAFFKGWLPGGTLSSESIVLYIGIPLLIISHFIWLLFAPDRRTVRSRSSN